MFRKVLAVVILAAILIIPAATSQAAIVKVARRLNVIDFFGGYAQPWGNYKRLSVLPFISGGSVVELDADRVYDPTYYFGFNYGQLRNDRLLYSLGFRWTHINVADDLEFTVERPTLNQYDIDFNVNFYFTSPSWSVVSPYAGLALHGGINSYSGVLLATENELTLAGGINFGADLVVWKSPSDRSFVALCSVNEWVYAASDERPKYLNFGAAFKYYFRP